MWAFWFDFLRRPVLILVRAVESRRLSVPCRSRRRLVFRWRRRCMDCVADGVGLSCGGRVGRGGEIGMGIVVGVIDDAVGSESRPA